MVILIVSGDEKIERTICVQKVYCIKSNCYVIPQVILNWRCVCLLQETRPQNSSSETQQRQTTSAFWTKMISQSQSAAGKNFTLIGTVQTESHSTSEIERDTVPQFPIHGSFSNTSRLRKFTSNSQFPQKAQVTGWSYLDRCVEQSRSTVPR